MDFRAIQPSELDPIWERIEPGIKHVLRKCPDSFAPRHVYHRLMNGQANLFTIDSKGFFVVEVLTDFTGSRILNVWLLWYPGGMPEHEAILERIKDIGRGAKCKALQFRSPRKGWASVNGFKQKQVTWEAEL